MKKLARFQSVISIFLLLFLSITLNSCVKTPDDNPPGTTTTSSTSTTTSSQCDTCLPPITMEGRNTFGCKINGKNWLAKSGKLFPGTRISYFEETISVYAEHVPNDEFLYLSFGLIADTGFYILPSHLTVSNARYGKTAPDGGNYEFLYEFDKSTTGYFHVSKLDLSSNGLISGTFAFDLYNEDFTDTIHITEGRFDIRF